MEQSYSVGDFRCFLRCCVCHSVQTPAIVPVAIQNYPLQASIFAAHSTLSVMSHAASAAHTTTTALAGRNHSKFVSCSIPRRSPFQRKPFVGDRLEHRQPVQTTALHRSHIVCITKVDEAGFQEEVLKVGYIPVALDTVKDLRSGTCSEVSSGHSASSSMMCLSE